MAQQSTSGDDIVNEMDVIMSELWGNSCEETPK